MSAKKRPSKKEKEEEEEELTDEELLEEEEYNPEEVFEEEEEKEEVIKDVTKLPKRRQHDLRVRNNKLLFLKALAINCYQDVGVLAEKCNLGTRAEAEQAISVVMGMIGETKEDVDFPERLLKSFNSLVPKGYPNRIQLDENDVNELTVLFKVYEDKLTNTAKLIDPNAIFGDNDNLDVEHIAETREKNKAKTINEDVNKKVMMDVNNPAAGSGAGSIPVDNGQVYPTPDGNRNSLDYYIQKYASPDIGLMEMALRSVPNPRPNSINSFITSFTDLYNDWMSNPMKMEEQLMFYFGPTHGKHAFRLWKDYRDNYQKKLGYSPLPPSSADMYTPYYNMMGSGPGAMAPMYNPYSTSPELEQERMMDRRMAKLAQIIQLRVMDKAMDNQTPSPVAGQNYEEILDKDGRVIKRVFLQSNGNNGGGYNNGGESSILNAVTSMFTKMLDGANNEKLELLRRVNTPDSTMSDFAKTIMTNHLNQQNPIQMMGQYQEIAKMFNQNNNPDANKSIDAIKLDVDSRIAMQELELKKLEMQHNWRMDENQSREADSNVDKWLSTFSTLGTEIVKPVAMKFVEGLGRAPMMGAMFGQQPTQQPQPAQGIVPPPNPYGKTEQEYAMEQQQYYAQQPPQQPYRHPPLQPLQPVGPQGRQFNPNPNPNQQQQQAPPMQRPISQVSEQELQKELSQLTPVQIQEIEDKMMLDDINREKIKNAIRAHKNARRFSRPPARTEQQQEAQNVLSPQQEQQMQEELYDEEEFDDNNGGDSGDEDYDDGYNPNRIPIASGQPKPPIEAKNFSPNQQKQEKKKKFSDYEQDTSTDLIHQKKLTRAQEDLLATGQLSPRELARAKDMTEEDEDDDYGYNPDKINIAGVYNESEEKLKEENLKNTKQMPATKKTTRKKPAPKKEEPVKEEEDVPEIQPEPNPDVPDFLEEAELIDSDDVPIE